MLVGTSRVLLRNDSQQIPTILGTSRLTQPPIATKCYPTDWEVFAYRSRKGHVVLGSVSPTEIEFLFPLLALGQNELIYATHGIAN